MEDISQLCQKLSITDANKEPIKLQETEIETCARSLNLCLVGKVLSTKLINRDGFRSAIQQMWRSVQGIQVESIGGNRFVFEFASAAERKRVLSSCPWNFDKSLIILEEPTDIGELSQLEFKHSPFWIQIHNIPLSCMSSAMGQILGKHLGEVLDVDKGHNDSCLGKFLRVRVKLDVSQPLQRCLKIAFNHTNTKTVILPLLYEKLPDFCFGCGLIGHTMKECPSTDEANSNDPTYGEWMRAPPKMAKHRATNHQEMAKEFLTVV